MNPSQIDLLQWSQIASNLCLSVAALVSAIVAAWALRSWRPPLHYEIALRLMNSVLVMRREVQGNRSIINNPIDRILGEGRLAIIHARNEVATRTLEAEVLRIRDLEGRLVELQALVIEYLISLEELEFASDEEDWERCLELRRTMVFGSGGDNDEYYHRLSAAVERIHDVLDPYLRGTGPGLIAGIIRRR